MFSGCIAFNSIILHFYKTRTKEILPLLYTIIALWDILTGIILYIWFLNLIITSFTTDFVTKFNLMTNNMTNIDHDQLYQQPSPIGIGALLHAATLVYLMSCWNLNAPDILPYRLVTVILVFVYRAPSFIICNMNTVRKR